ncbi:MAG: transposase [Candidatus Omnitrophica bacterium]|nr:transposase [Candidatus Omnitrophota bacterium]MDD5654839.1 transposase [Candidatus Omnitrophota bacterium]
MARRPRLLAIGTPCHIVQRGNNRNNIFYRDEDYLFFLEVLSEAKEKYPCYIYSYCLMINHFHLLIEPKEKNNIGSLMKFVGVKYVHYVNKHYNRTGTLWEGRFKSCIIEAESYFLSCLKYIEMNPVKANIVSSPESYRWSSYRVRAYGDKNKIVDIDPWYKSLGEDDIIRQVNYRRFFQKENSKTIEEVISDMTNKNGVVGSSGFKKKMERAAGMEIVIRRPGRPVIKEN